MFNLIIKDILIQKKTLVFMLIYIIVFMFALRSLGSGAFSGIIIAVTYQLVTTACNQEEKVNSDIILNSMPIRRRDIVLAKYLSIFVYTIAATLCYYVITIILSFTGMQTTFYAITPKNLAGAICATIVMNSLYFPFYFKWGFVKAKIVSFILFFLFFFGIISLLNVIEDAQEMAWLQSISNLFTGRTDIQTFFILIGLAFILLLGSYGLSVKFYNSREF